MTATSPDLPWDRGGTDYEQVDATDSDDVVTAAARLADEIEADARGNPDTTEWARALHGD